MKRKLLKDSAVQDCLNTALDCGSPKAFLLALRGVAEARAGGIGGVAKASGLNRESLYKMLSEKGNPELASIQTLLKALGFRLTVLARKKPSKGE